MVWQVYCPSQTPHLTLPLSRLCQVLGISNGSPLGVTPPHTSLGKWEKWWIVFHWQLNHGRSCSAMGPPIYCTSLMSPHSTRLRSCSGLLSLLVLPSLFSWLWFCWIVSRDSVNLIHPFMYIINWMMRYLAIYLSHINYTVLFQAK